MTAARDPITRFEGGAVALSRDDVDTDQIIPARFLKTTTRHGLGTHLFDGWRYDPAGAPRTDFILNQAAAAGASVLVAGRNFGCGSSREHAPIALGSAGCKVVLAESFARIFFRNSVATGELYPCESPDRLCDVLKTGDVVTVDLDAGTVTSKNSGKVYKFNPLGDVRPVVDAGGLFNYARKTGMIPK